MFDSEVDSPEKLRTQTFPESHPLPSSPSVKAVPPPALLVFTPSKIPVEVKIPTSNVNNVVESLEDVLSMEAEVSEAPAEKNFVDEKETVEATESVEEKEKKETALEVKLRLLKESLPEWKELQQERRRLLELEEEKDNDKESCRNCDAEMTPDHQCKSGGEESESGSIDEENNDVESEKKQRLLKERDRLRKLIAKLQKELDEGRRPKCWHCGILFQSPVLERLRFRIMLCDLKPSSVDS